MRLYINIDHVATVRQARGGADPDPVAAARLCEDAGADGITAHLREDRRHIQDADIEALARTVRTVLNFEMACTAEMIDLAMRIKPHQVSLVPERRMEVTTEGGLDVRRDARRVRDGVERLNAAGIITSLFIDADADTVRGSRELGARAVELHTGPYAHHPDDPSRLRALRSCAELGASLGLKVYAGHGLTVANLGAVAAIPQVEEVSIGHSVVSRALFIGLAEAVRELRRVMDSARRSS